MLIRVPAILRKSDLRKESCKKTDILIVVVINESWKTDKRLERRVKQVEK